MSVRTVESRIAALRRKLGVDSRAGLIGHEAALARCPEGLERWVAAIAEGQVLASCT